MRLHNAVWSRQVYWRKLRRRRLIWIAAFLAAVGVAAAVLSTVPSSRVSSAEGVPEISPLGPEGAASRVKTDKSSAGSEAPQVLQDSRTLESPVAAASADPPVEQSDPPRESSSSASIVGTTIPSGHSYVLRSPPFVTEVDAKWAFIVADASGVEPRIVVREDKWYVEAGPTTDREFLEKVTAEIRWRTPNKLQFSIEESN